MFSVIFAIFCSRSPMTLKPDCSTSSLLRTVLKSLLSSVSFRRFSSILSVYCSDTVARNEWISALVDCASSRSSWSDAYSSQSAAYAINSSLFLIRTSNPSLTLYFCSEYSTVACSISILPILTRIKSIYESMSVIASLVFLSLSPIVPSLAIKSQQT